MFIVLCAILTHAAHCQPTGFTNLDHLAVYKNTRMAIGAAASILCFTSNIYFYSINRGNTSFVLYFYRTQVSLGSDLCVWAYVRQSVTRLCADLTDVTLADEDSNLIPTDDVNRAILGNVAPSGGQH